MCNGNGGWRKVSLYAYIAVSFSEIRLSPYGWGQ